ncbi:alkaline phosphatase D family protein [Spongiibacter pelagi]|uniref:alkaline phosphatase D family protein n=1 Tax=Spongiibacter pelagi TaxID=2760804 RepID=UPI001CC23762|nr:alkaline phosphatase D family protein [Spongiibacter pelagi]
MTACGGGSNRGPASSGGDDVVPGTQTTPGAFVHGVASGDPLSDRVILWAHLSPEESDLSEAVVRCQLSDDPSFSNLLIDELLATGPERDFTVKYDAAGLLADKHYWYRFIAGETVSTVGRTRTLPAAGESADRLRFAVCSCSSYPHGYFSVYRMMANRSDLDFIMHLGDYIYEYEQDGYGDHADRLLDPAHEIIVLDDYRRRYALYRKDPDLQAAHAIHPFINVWDDHESADNSWKDGASNHNDGEGEWPARKAQAIQAYFEWIPIRPPTLDQTSIYRSFEYGDLASFMMLDTRLEGREEQLAIPIDPSRAQPRDLLGQTQKDWFKNKLATAQGQWKFVGQQVMFAQLQILELERLLPAEFPTSQFSPLIAINMDQWDGYAVEREEILNFIEDEAIDNVVVLTGDIHTSWANEVYKSSTLISNLTTEPLAAEFVTPSITSPGFPDGAAELAAALLPVVNPHMKYIELKTKGFILMDVTAERTQAEYYYAEDISTADMIGVESDTVKTVAVYDGSSRMTLDTPISTPRS